MGDKNVLVFGEAGAGKSSIINLIAARTVAPTSNEVLRSAFEHQSYVVPVGQVNCRFWEITGLDEETAPGPKAENNLKDLFQRLARAGGLNLVVYCFRAARFSAAFLHNYHVFYSGICRKKVPIALVVTGLEYHEDRMEMWWDTEGPVLRDRGVHFDAHACVTTLNLDHEVVRKRRHTSQGLLRGLILAHYNLQPWRIQDSFMSQMLPMFPSLIQSKHPSDKETTRTIVVCDMIENAHIECPPGVFVSWQSYTCSVGRHQCQFIRTNTGIQPNSTIPHGIGGLLIFYTSPLINSAIAPDDVDALKKFHDTAGGLTCPMIVVLRGCDDEAVAVACWDAVGPGLAIRAHPIPNPVDGRSSGTTGLVTMIERLWINPLGAYQDGS